MDIGIVGCGNISGTYIRNLARFGVTHVSMCADLDYRRALETAETHSIPRTGNTEDVLCDSQVEIVLNLTVPDAHFEVARAALKRGKHVYNEKPLAVTVEQGRELLDLAKARELRIGCAPDTVLGAGIQTCRKLVDDGAIGAPVGANAFMLCAGHESWHPSPEFYYRKGGGPLLDMGPYYLSALVTLFGPFRSAIGAARATHPTRTITSEPKRGMIVPVETETHVVGVLEFANGAIAQITTSFDVQRTSLPCLEIYGTEGSLIVPDPNAFGGEPRLYRRDSGQWEPVPLTHGFSGNDRGLGVLDMALAIQQGRPHRAGGELALHVLEAMHAVLRAAESGSRVEIATPCERPAPMPEDPSEFLRLGEATQA